MVFLLLADGFEETEAFAPLDILRRAGVDVRTVGITGTPVTSSHGLPVLTDMIPEQVDLAQADMVILPGGMPGTKNLYACDFVRNAISYCIKQSRYVAAICAAPSIILGGMRLLDGKNATCYPGMESGMTGANALDRPVCVDGKIITARAAGAAFDFGLALCAALCGQDTADNVRHEIHYVG